MRNILQTGLKRNLYLRPRKDNDLLLNIIEAGLGESGNGDFAHYCRELMRDGLRFRRLIATGQIQAGALLTTSIQPTVEDESERLERKYGAIVDEGMLAEGEVD
jgi:hypothetical protein